MSCLLLALAGSCRDDVQREEAPLEATDSLATMREVRMSLAGQVAPGAQTYTYHGLYAGMTRATLRSRVLFDSTRARWMCAPDSTKTGTERCSADVRLLPDSGDAHVEATYSPGAAGARDGDVAHEVVVTRELPLDVDGVMLARALSDAFEAQTSLLDRRDASYGHRQALVRMGTLNGARQNFAEVVVQARNGREELVVRLSRAASVTKPSTPKKTGPREKTGAARP